VGGKRFSGLSSRGLRGTAADEHPLACGLCHLQQALQHLAILRVFDGILLVQVLPEVLSILGHVAVADGGHGVTLRGDNAGQGVGFGTSPPDGRVEL